MKIPSFVFAAAVLAGLLHGQALDPNTLTLFKQPADVWPTYNGDYSGRRFSDLNQINQSNIDSLRIEWMYRITGIGPQRGVGNPTIKSTPLMVNGIAYFTIPDHVFAVNARTGEQLWQYDFEDHGGHLLGYGQREPRVCRPEPQGRQSVYRVDRCFGCRHWQAALVFSGLSA